MKKSVENTGASRLVLDRRMFLALSSIALFPASIATAAPGVLVIALDIADTVTLDPARMGTYTPALTLHTAYETLVTMAPGDYVNVKPNLAETFERTPGDDGWRFTLRQGVTFASGNPLTAADVKFSIDRMINIKDQPSGYARTVDRIEIVDDKTIDVFTKDPNDPILTVLCSPQAGIVDSKVVAENGGSAALDADTADTATKWLNGNSAGSGPYQVKGWERNGQIVLEQNPNYWNGTPAYKRIVITHIPESGSQLLAVRRGEVDVAFNLTPEQLKSLAGDAEVEVVRTLSQDWTYISLNGNPEINEFLAKREARLAVAHAIDYDGIRDSLVDGAATRAANYISVGIGGSTEEQTKEIGYHDDLEKAKDLLKQAGLPDGFSFPLQYPTGVFGGVPYQLLAQKIQADLARVGINAELQPMDSVMLRTLFKAGKSPAFINYFNPPAVEPLLNAEAAFLRGAQRAGWDIPEEIGEIAIKASRTRDLEQQAALYKEFTIKLQEEGHFIILFQPYYQVAVRKDVTDFALTGAGWFAELAPSSRK
jgi:peptide/nickel transport system substrate-binding protein